MKLQDYWKIIKERRKVVKMVFFTTVLTTLVTSLLWPAKYQGSATIMLDYDSSSPLNISMVAAPQALNSIEYINTQVEILESRRIGVAVVDMLHLDKVPDVIEDYNDEKNGNSWKFWKHPGNDIKVWLADEYLAKYVKITPGKDSRFLNICFYASDPTFAAAVANAYAKAYTDYNLELKVTPYKDAGKWFAEKLKDAKGYTDRSTEQLREYQQKKGIIAQQGPQGGVYDDAMQRLDQINQQLAAAKTKQYDAQVALKRVDQCGGRYDTLPEVQASTLIQGMKAEKLKLETDLTELSAKVGPGYPQYARTQSMLDTVKGKIAVEERNIVSAIREDSTAANRRVAALEGAVSGLKKESTAASVSRYEMDSLTREADTYKQVYEAVLKKYNETALQGDINKTNVFLVDAAVPPTKQYSPKILLNLILASFVGFWMGAGLAIYAELHDDTVKSTETMEQVFGIAVLGTIASTGEI